MKALVLCGGMPQVALIQELKRRGIETILADMNNKVLAREYADEFANVSVLDVCAVKQLAIEKKVDFLMTVCADQVLQVVAEVSEALGLPCYIDYKTAVLVSQKSYMKKVFSENGIPTSKYVVMDKLDFSAVQSLKFPLIVKPVDAYSSRGVSKVNNAEELQISFEKATSISRTKNAIVEEFVEGKELTVDVYVEDGKAHVLCISELYKTGEEGKFIINRSQHPANISDSVAMQIADTAQKIAEAFGLVNTPMLIQLISNGKEISVVEFCARTGGGVKFLMIKKFTGFDVIKAVVDLTLGEKPHVETRNEYSKITVNEFVYCHAGVLDHLKGFEELLRDGVIDEYSRFKRDGTVFERTNDSGDRLAYFSISADNMTELLHRHREANKKIRAISTDNRDLIRHDYIEKFYDGK